MAGMIQNATKNAALLQATEKRPTITTTLNTLLDSEGIRKRFDELLGDRASQFISSVISLVNADPSLQQAIYEAPNTVITAALKAAIYDLPIDPGLGYGYIIAFKNNKRLPDGSKRKVCEASYILGYRGMEQLAIRSGQYKKLPDAVDVREGELISYNRLTGEAEFHWVEDEDERETLPIIGYAGYFQLLNGAEKTIFMTKKQIEKHEAKYRKGDYIGKGWREDWDSMAKKTVLRRLIGKYGIMSIDYRMQPANQDFALNAAIINGDFGGEQEDIPVDFEVDTDTGEVLETTPFPSDMETSGEDATETDQIQL